MRYTLDIKQQLLGDHNSVVFMQCQREQDNGLILKYVSENSVWMCLDVFYDGKPQACQMSCQMACKDFPFVYCFCSLFGCITALILKYF